jgi:phage-related protein
MQLRGVQFGDFHTADDWNLIMHEKIVSPPVPKTNYVSVPGRDGDLDLTEALSGVVNYQDRNASYTFLLTDGTHADRVELISQIIGVLHGQRVRIIDTDDYPDYYMIGRLSVTDVSNSNAYGILKIEAVCQPWRYAINQKSKAVTVAASDGNVSVTMTNNGYKTVAPTLTVTGTIMLKYGTTTTTLSAGTYILAGLRFTPGVNTVTVAGTGSITISYQEAIF